MVGGVQEAVISHHRVGLTSAQAFECAVLRTQMVNASMDVMHI